MKKRIKVLVVALGLLVVAGFNAVPHLLPLALTFYRPDICFTSGRERRVFLTIDDAPSMNTAEIMRVLKKHDVPATFFVISDRVKSIEQLREITAANYSVGNHLKTTKACSDLSMAEFRSDFDRCAAVLQRVGASVLFRPPSDFGTKEQIAYARSRGYRTVMGTVFPMDHWISDTWLLVRIARWLTVGGGIVILHDGDTRGLSTAAALDQLIPKLKEAGYIFGRLEDEPNKAPEPTTMAVTPRATE